ncbi:MAG: family 78 glycoside hydrolase catalytic domain [Victivallales bacterium]|nr:family 78 glycoside hydrolase catalytic domain [Victivallales bacterium]
MTTEHVFIGKWITSGRFAALEKRNVFHRQLAPAVTPETPELQNRHVLFRRKFTLSAEEAASAKIYISADDYYKLYVNGKFVGQGPAAGYDFHYFYNVMDLSKFVQPGENTLAVHTYYQGLLNRVWVSGDHQHGLILDLEAGGKIVVASDETFLQHEHTAYSSCGVVGYDTQFMERYDAAAPEVGFEQSGFDDSGWEGAQLRQHESYRLFRQPSAQLVFEEIRPVSLKRTGNCLALDFGAVYVGAMVFQAHGPKGAEITMRFGQELLEDGHVRYDMRCNCVYEEFFRLSGGPKDILNPFDFKSFRYAEILLPEGVEVDADSIVLTARHYPFQLQAKCKYHDEKALAVWKLCVDTLHYGFQEVNQDCMDREKGYYLGDGCYTLLTYCMLTGNYVLVEKFFDDFLATKFINRGLMTCAACAMMQEIAEYPLMMYPLLYAYCRLTGKLDYVRKRYDDFADILDFYREQYTDADGLINRSDKWCVVEWPPNFQDGYDAEIEEGKMSHSKHVALNAYYLGAIKYFNAVAQLLGRSPYAELAPLEASFVKAFWDSEHKQFRDSDVSQHISFVGNAYPYYFGLFPEDAGKQEFVRRVRQARLSKTSLFVVFPLLAALSRDGENELVHDLLTDDMAWLHMLSEGATRTFEGWGKEMKWNTSLFHLTMSVGAMFLADWDLQDILLA